MGCLAKEGKSFTEKHFCLVIWNVKNDFSGLKN